MAWARFPERRIREDAKSRAAYICSNDNRLNGLSGPLTTFTRRSIAMSNHMHTVAVVGVTGTIGRRVAQALANAGHQVIGLSRNPARAATGRVVAVDLRNAAAAE